MGILNIRKNKSINIDINAIADVVGNSVIECYGVFALAKYNNSKNCFDLIEDKNEFVKGITCEINKKGGYEISINVVVIFGTKITEIIYEIRNKVKYMLKKVFGFDFEKINVYVQGIKEIN